MKIAVALNGSISSESMALYALKFAKIQGYNLLLFHIKNKKDDIEQVEASINRLVLIAAPEHIQTQTDILEESTDIESYLLAQNIDTLFCSTRKSKQYFNNSFSQKLIDMNLDMDIAVARIVNISNITEMEKMVLSIKEDKLSVKKFTFFATLASEYKTKTEIYSITPVSKFRLASTDIHTTREKLASINHNLRHYKKLSVFMPFSLNIKHNFSSNETDSILSEIAKSDVGLLVVGAKRLSISSIFSRELPIERLMKETSVNIIAYYTKE